MERRLPEFNKMRSLESQLRELTNITGRLKMAVVFDAEERDFLIRLLNVAKFKNHNYVRIAKSVLDKLNG